MQYRKVPVVIDAEQFFVGRCDYVGPAQHVCFGEPKAEGDCSASAWDNKYWVTTLEGDTQHRQTVVDGDWIIKGIKGEFYPIKPDIFEATYERV